MEPIMVPYWVPAVIRGLADAVPQFCPSSLSTCFNIIYPFQVQHLPPLQTQITSFNSRTPRVMPPTRSILRSSKSGACKVFSEFDDIAIKLLIDCAVLLRISLQIVLQPVQIPALYEQALHQQEYHTNVAASSPSALCMLKERHSHPGSRADGLA